MIQSYENIACKFCGCLCDDIKVEVGPEGKIRKALRACPNGRSFFLDYDPSPQKPTLDGRQVEWDQAIAQAAAILQDADSPLIYGLSSSSNEAQRKAVALADRIGAIIDSTSSVCHGPTGLAFQTVGNPTCTLGEVRDRADLVVFWGCNPLESHVRHLSRYSLNPKGLLTPRGKKDRHMVVVDVRPTASTKTASQFIQIEPGWDYEALSALRAMLKGYELSVRQIGGVPIEQWAELAQRMKSCSYGVAFFGMGLTMSAGREHNVAELFTLGAELNRFARFSVIPMRGHGNVAGADKVLTWQSGYPMAVSFARGYPQYGPGEFSAVDVLARKDADAALIIASDPSSHFPRAAARHLERIPTILINSTPNLTGQAARIFFPTACYGIDAEGTACRMDNVPIRLRAVMDKKRPSDEEVICRITEAIAQ
jgi:formylmethanofuran dehydrogenase subunit B